ncbi:helix-turn-helix domain protein [Peptococcaceae bacterium CEB3]|nr:helix-turn-helix domain protein [Peptococcaceae bacterium CEB3]
MSTGLWRAKKKGETNWDKLPIVLDTREVASILRCSVIFVRNMCAKKEIPHIRHGRTLRIPRDTLRDFMETSSRENLEIPPIRHIPGTVPKKTNNLITKPPSSN